MSRYWLINTNKKYLPDGNDGTDIFEEEVVATYDDGGGGKMEELSKVRKSDYVFSYLSSEGIIAFGIAVEDEPEKVEPGQEEAIQTLKQDAIKYEYHLPVEWLAVVYKSDAIDTNTRDLVSMRVSGRPLNRTVVELEKDDNPELLADIIMGRYCSSEA